MKLNSIDKPLILNGICKKCHKNYRINLETDYKYIECCSDKCKREFFKLTLCGFNIDNVNVSMIAEKVISWSLPKEITEYRTFQKNIIREIVTR
jgi:hypothetical protein